MHVCFQGINLGRQRFRTTFTEWQVNSLEAEFQRTQYLPKHRAIELANLLNISHFNIKIWFQNRRQKAKKLSKALSSSQVNLPSRAQRTGTENHSVSSSDIESIVLSDDEIEDEQISDKETEQSKIADENTETAQKKVDNEEAEQEKVIGEGEKDSETDLKSEPAK